LQNLDAVVFDMDGLLLDTELISLKTFVASCREHHFEPDLKIYVQCIGTNSARTREILLEGYGPDFPYNEILKLWRSSYDEETGQSIPVKPGAVSLLKYLEKRPLKKAVATSSRRENAFKKLSNARILHFFDFILGGDQITRGKPDPEMYLTACRELGAEPQRCLALEDSENGVRSALSAGLMVIQVPDLIPPTEEMKAWGHAIAASLAEVEKMIRGADPDN
jgi:HAD superfamily hydrolase (TIGR01509 family)